MNDPRHIIETYYQRLADRDREGLLELIHPDITVTYHGGVGVFPWSGQFTGHNGFNDFFAVIAEHLDVVNVEQTRWTTDEQAVVVQCVGQWRVKANAARVDAGMVNIFTITEDLITGYDVHADTEAFRRAMDA